MTNKRYLDKLVIAAGQRTAEKDYWLDKLSGKPGKCAFPYDHKKEGECKQTHRVINDRFSTGLSTALTKLSGASDVRLHVILTAALTLLLNKYTGKKDIIVGTPIFESRTVNQGEFTNTVLALRNQIENAMTFKELLFTVRQTCSEAVANQGYPIEILIGELGLSLPAGDFPLFETAVLIENIQKKVHLDQVSPNMIFSFSRAGEGIECCLEYNSCLYEQLTAVRILNYFKRLLEVVLADAEIKLCAVSILSGDDREQLLYTFNDTAIPYPKDRAIQELFEEQVRKTPDKIALAGPAYSGREPENTSANGQPVCLTYRQLNQKASALARFLIKKGVNRDNIIGVLTERSVEMVIGILAILKANGAYLPVSPQDPLIRQAYMLKDCNTGLLLTSRGLSETAGLLSYQNLETIFIEDGNREGIFQGPDEPLAVHSPDRLAYIMYTSGSTGEAKGVPVEHRNVVRLVKNTNYIELQAGTRILLTGAPVFDATTFEIWGALLNGGTLFLVKSEVILDAGQLGGVLLKNKINTMWLTSALFNQLVQQDDTIFSPLRYLLVGGDVLSPFFINKCRRKNKGLKIINGYGPTENTTFSTTYLIEKEFRESIPIGKPIANSTAYILDENRELQIPGVSGELVVGGDGVSRGYLNDPELTAEKFISALGQDILYKTGDLARWLPDGNIEFNGRIDSQVKIRGFRVELDEIANHLLNHEKIKEAVVTVNESSGEKYLCAYIVGDVSGAEVVRLYLAKRVPGYMIPSYFTFLEKMPLTPNGKIDRKTLPPPEAETTGGYAAPRNDAERKMTIIWSAALGIDADKIGIDDNFFESGGHSLKAIVIISRIHRVFNVKLSLRELFITPTIRSQVEYIKGSREDLYTTILSREKKEYYALASAQKRIYVTQQMNPDSTNYNIYTVLKLAGELDEKKLESSVAELIKRHESLRTCFVTAAGDPVQKIQNPGSVVFKIEYFQTGSIDRFIRPFDLSSTPLLRVGLIREEKESYILMVDMHHIISDGASLELFRDELTAIYAGKELPQLYIQYKDYSEWQNSPAEKERIARQEEFWMKQFDGYVPGLDLPYDYPRSAAAGNDGGTLFFEMNGDETKALNSLALKEGTTLFTVLSAIYFVFLEKICNRGDIVIGTPASGRLSADLEPLIGMFVNTLSLRNYPEGDKSFREFLAEVCKRTLLAFENQEYQFEDLVAKLEVNREANRNPLFDVMFSMQNQGQAGAEIPGLKFVPYTYEFKTSKFDLILTAAEAKDKLFFSFEYNTLLFKKGTIERFIGYFKDITAAISKNIETKLSDINIVCRLIAPESTAALEVEGDFGF